MSWIRVWKFDTFSLTDRIWVDVYNQMFTTWYNKNTTRKHELPPLIVLPTISASSWSSQDSQPPRPSLASACDPCVAFPTRPNQSRISFSFPLLCLMSSNYVIFFVLIFVKVFGNLICAICMMTFATFWKPIGTFCLSGSGFCWPILECKGAWLEIFNEYLNYVWIIDCSQFI